MSTIDARISHSSHNIKPNHRGRVIKDVKPVVGLEPLGRGPQPPLSKRVSSGDISADGTSLGRPDSLKKRVHELEIENGKLRRSLDEAEQSIKTYRNFLSAKSSTSNVSVAIQTDFVSVNRPRDPDASLRSENATLRAQVTELQKSIAEFASGMDLLTKDKVASERASAAKLEGLLTEIENLRAMMSSVVAPVPPMSSSHLRIVQHKSTHHTKQFITTKDAVCKSLDDFNHFMRHAVDLIVNEITRHEKGRSQNHIALTTTPHKNTLSSPSSKKTSKTHTHTKVASVSETGCSPMARRDVVDNSTDPLSPLFIKGLGPSRSNSTLPIASVEATSPHKSTVDQNSSKSQHEFDRMRDEAIQIMMESLQAATEKYESEKLTLEAQASRDAEQVALLSNKLLVASREFQQVLNKFGKEINAVKHMAHCKDLVRIAGLRELGLERDRLVNEMKYAKLVQHIFYTLHYLLACHLLKSLCMIEFTMS